MRKFSPRFGTVDAASKTTIDEKTPLDDDDLVKTREAIFAQVDRECDAYIDAIFWGARTRNTTTTSLGLIGAATGTILAATGVGTTAIAVTAAGFGLSTALVDSYYETFLYSLEPSGVVGLMKEARSAYRRSPDLIKPTSEGMLLAQAQGYIRQCSPPKIEALVNEAISAGEVTATERPETKPLSADDLQNLTTLRAKPSLTIPEAMEFSMLVQRLNTAGVAPVPDTPDGGDGAAAAPPAAPDGGAAPTPAATGVPTTRIK